jgi:putative membrane protein
VLPTLGPVLLGAGPQGVRRVLREGNFELFRSPDSIRVRHGLTETRTSTLPLHRIQAVSVAQPLFWRPVGWWRVGVNVAGVAASGNASDDVIVSVGTRAEALTALRVLWPRLDLDLVVAGMVGDGPTPGYVVAPPRSTWVSPVVRQRNGYAVAPEGVLVRTGRAKRCVEVVPHARIQSMTVKQGPVDRRLALASVHLISTPGSVDPWVYHLDASDALELLNQQTRRSRAARVVAPAGPSGAGPTTA